LTNGAKKANLKPEYIEKLENMPHYIPSQETLDNRKLIPELDSLPPMTIAELKALDEENEEYNAISIFGYIIKLEKAMVGFNAHKGRDITNRQIRHFNGISADEGEAGLADHGQPPYANLQTLDADSMDYTLQWLDYYWNDKMKLNKDCFVGHLVEFLEQKTSDAAAGKASL
jgi:hypothetical protein